MKIYHIQLLQHYQVVQKSHLESLGSQCKETPNLDNAINMKNVKQYV